VTAPADMSAMSPLAREVARAIAATSGKRIHASGLFHAATVADPGLIGDPVARSRFRDALLELEAAALIALPSPASRTAWDRRLLPELPVWITRTSTAPATGRDRPEPRVWPGVLEAAGRIASRTDEHEVLDRVASWLRDGPHPALVPVEERSLELFDDEKALDRYLMTRLFTSGALTLDLLACYAPPPPFASQHVPGTGPTRLLVVENLATYTSFLTALRSLAPRSRPDLHVGWGVGAAFEQSVLSTPLLEPTPASAYYFGDLDQAGLRIASNATAKAVAAGLLELRPLEAPYQFLLDGPSHWRRPDASSRGTRLDQAEALSWLPSTLRSRASQLFAARQRIPQERLGLEALHREPTLLTALYPPD
jgi:hypothetical protein